MKNLMLGIGHNGIYFLRWTYGKDKKVQPLMLFMSHKYDSIINWKCENADKVLHYTLGGEHGGGGMIFHKNADTIQRLLSEYMHEYRAIVNAITGADSPADAPAARRSRKDLEPEQQHSHSGGVEEATRLSELVALLTGPESDDIKRAAIFDFAATQGEQFSLAATTELGNH